MWQPRSVGPSAKRTTDANFVCRPCHHRRCHRFRRCGRWWCHLRGTVAAPQTQRPLLGQPEAPQLLEAAPRHASLVKTPFGLRLSLPPLLRHDHGCAATFPWVVLAWTVIPIRTPGTTLQLQHDSESERRCHHQHSTDYNSCSDVAASPHSRRRRTAEGKHPVGLVIQTAASPRNVISIPRERVEFPLSNNYSTPRKKERKKKVRRL